MERVQIKANARESLTKGELRQLRQDGFVPGVIYGRKKEAVPVTVDGKDLINVTQLPTGMNTLVDLSVSDMQDTVIIKELKRDILFLDRLEHVDFLRISLEEKLEVSVPIHLTGTPAGAKDGGVIHHLLREVNIRSLPTEIPEQMELDISNLEIGQSLTVADLSSLGFEVLSEQDEAIVTIASPRVAEETTGEKPAEPEDAALPTEAKEE